MSPPRDSRLQVVRLKNDGRGQRLGAHGIHSPKKRRLREGEQSARGRVGTEDEVLSPRPLSFAKGEVRKRHKMSVPVSTRAKATERIQPSIPKQLLLKQSRVVETVKIACGTNGVCRETERDVGEWKI